jgi:FtsH-binding integral membrane protein
MHTYDDSRMEHLGGRQPVAKLDISARADFITKTYGHLLGAIIAFTLFEIAIFQTGLAETLASKMLGGGSIGWLPWMGGYMLVGFLASRLAWIKVSKGTQYLGLALYVVASGIIFVPLLFIANHYAPGVITNAAMVTLVGFSGLTAIVFYTRKDFSFMRKILLWASFAALGFIVMGAFAGWSGGNIFPVLMIALAGGWILHDTSNVMLHCPQDRYVAAALELFASVALMFWYVIILFLNSRD